MRLASYLVGSTPAFGVMVEGGVIDVPRHWGYRSMREWIAGGLPGAAELAEQLAEHDISSIQLLAPVPDPAHIIGIGLNTKSHFEETAVIKNRKPGDYPKYPRLFIRYPDSLVPDGTPLRVPRRSDTLDYEGEIGLVIGKIARNVKPEDWREYVIGLTCLNDGSVRGYQLHSDQVTAGKNFRHSGACGPAIVTLDEIGDLDSLELTVDVNGERRQHLTLDDLIFSFGELISYVSEPFELQPGDVISTGSPKGIGALAGKYLRAGDRVAITLGKSGGRTLLTLSNPVLGD